MLQLMVQYPEMDSVFVANDQMALSAILCAQRAGRRVPQDLAIVGFDGLPEAAYFSPPLTTIDQNQYELGCSAVRRLIELIKSSRDGEPTETSTIVIPPRLIRRESSGAEGESN
jgi:DNA-binding LacI/PurR family transcriptional regulator